ncbi:ATP-binding cassette domain-containing protein [Paenibacillus timonensis]|uniref:ABC-F family ATP-binding cassette domain-containing protein n=1 Tax=Paenibacillus timonensis TaxID=225915 RepID=A0ABW3S7K5_9BACL|nr:ABC-F family ATP-binding cassette domain-containing protein [Paenibacillus timonensis]MCH1638476.1 ATP-binding cassette domain-containing protein [Paenibacillus timonensis]
MSLLEMSGVTHRFGDKELYRGASLELHAGEHMGLVGQNGAGKSTLIRMLTGEVIPDQGSIQWQPRLRLGHLDQYARISGAVSIRDYLKTAFDELYELERKMAEIYREVAVTGDESRMKLAALCQEKLDAGDFYDIDSRIDQTAMGLGIQAMGMERPMSELSGGQRARVILAKLLLEEPDVLLLDEPTNFLDREHVEWLAGALASFRGAFIVVSHDASFLQKVTNCICDVELGSIRKYPGSYNDFMRQKEHHRRDYERRYEAQQKKIEATESYIRKNIAGVNSKIAQGRRKQLERMERIGPPVQTHPPAFRFQELASPGLIALETRRLVVGYGQPLLPPLSFKVSGGEKLVVSGFNGIGKSTLLNTLVRRISAVSGEYRFADRVHIGYFSQELAWEEPTMTPIQYIAEFRPDLDGKEIRRHLARCGLNQSLVARAIGTLSGGEQSKVKLCRLLLTPCNFLILDEPTNHLDQEAKAALRQALIEFRGSVLLVSHDRSFYQDWADRVLRIGK